MSADLRTRLDTLRDMLHCAMILTADEVEHGREDRLASARDLLADVQQCLWLRGLVDDDVRLLIEKAHRGLHAAYQKAEKT